MFSDYLITTWTSENKLPTDTIVDIIQDKNGFILIGTYDGLIQFDGENFRLINKYTLAGYESVSARVLFEDKKGVLWVGTNGDGLIRMSNDRVDTFTTRWTDRQFYSDYYRK